MAEEMERLLPRVENEPIFDWVILGVGTDGHYSFAFFPERQILRTLIWRLLAFNPKVNKGEFRLVPGSLVAAGE